ncbi:hypothetical protein R3P38DRAFT_3212106 [Favolaschia claudopus]|uniref:MYND-type domain-containing protein n=1 Tax=Favolaschia claudopus TaxID=2862362 RepID=A0AAW0AFU2_9AGAR
MPGASSLLSARELDNIPFTLRAVAGTAANTSSSPEVVADALFTLNDSLLQRTERHQIIHTFIPLVFALLDPARLPPGPDDTSSSDFVSRCLCASRAIILFGMCDDATMRSHTPKLWPRIWPWIQLMTNHDCFPEAMTNVCGQCSMLNVLTPLVDLPTGSAARTVFNTPGFGVFFANAWQNTLCCWDEGHQQNKGVSPGRMLSAFIQRCFQFPSVIDDLVDGAGGIHELATLIVNHTLLLVHDMGGSYYNVPEITCDMLEEFDIARQFIDFMCDRKPSAWVALQSTPYLEAATIICRAFGSSTVLRDSKPTFLAMWQYLPQISRLLPTAELEHVVLAVNSGLLHSCLICGSRGPPNGVKSSEEEFTDLNIVLDCVGQATLDSQALAAMADSLFSLFLFAEVCPRWERWSAFMTLVRSRLELLPKFSSPSVSSTRACDNIECPILRVDKSELRRCARCHIALYCSKDCQKLAWMVHGHRERCQGLTSHSKSDNRDTRFKFSITLREYKANKLHILLQQLGFILRNGNTDFCVVMDYDGGRCTSSVTAIDPRAELFKDHPSVGWDAREGYTELHAIRFAGNNDQVHFLPLRRSSSVIFDGLGGLARELPQGVDVMQLATSHPLLFERVRELAELDVMETYGGDANL